jgi:hypothetical protein
VPVEQMVAEGLESLGNGGAGPRAP